MKFPYNPPPHTGADHQCTVSIGIGCNQWLSLAEPTLKVHWLPAPVCVDVLLVVGLGIFWEVLLEKICMGL